MLQPTMRPVQFGLFRRRSRDSSPTGNTPPPPGDWGLLTRPPAERPVPKAVATGPNVERTTNPGVPRQKGRDRDHVVGKGILIAATLVSTAVLGAIGWRVTHSSEAPPPLTGEGASLSGQGGTDLDEPITLDGITIYPHLITPAQTDSGNLLSPDGYGLVVSDIAKQLDSRDAFIIQVDGDNVRQMQAACETSNADAEANGFENADPATRQICRDAITQYRKVIEDLDGAVFRGEVVGIDKKEAMKFLERAGVTADQAQALITDDKGIFYGFWLQIKDKLVPIIPVNIGPTVGLLGAVTVLLILISKDEKPKPPTSPP